MWTRLTSIPILPEDETNLDMISKKRETRYQNVLGIILIEEHMYRRSSFNLICDINFLQFSFTV